MTDDIVDRLRLADWELGPAERRFYQHMEDCAWCFYHPFQLCGAGKGLRRKAIMEILEISTDFPLDNSWPQEDDTQSEETGG